MLGLRAGPKLQISNYIRQQHVSEKHHAWEAGWVRDSRSSVEGELSLSVGHTTASARAVRCRGGFMGAGAIVDQSSCHLRRAMALCARRSCLRRLLPIACVLSGTLACQQGFAQDFLLQGPPVIVKTADGPVEGRKQAAIVVFRGIPYAAAPVGSLRFRPPVTAKPWKAVRPAWTHTAACPQIRNRIDVMEDGEDVMDEDCLTVNVWTPSPDSSHRPVMVFINGGGFVEGSAADSGYDGATLAARGDVVVVSLQYRLGIFGFLELGELGGADYTQSGNVGILG